ncbi:acyl-CoA binding protein 1 [Actinidia rufa]|uniref:Acyl-CoA binding protein 1 n=1 Tax=Actinidia rufa TaxID=165716 RepID=A0A7J0DCA9_9ERIC|nr:acyl-CoA binding protein 1 [Actinidia rufa]
MDDWQKLLQIAQSVLIGFIFSFLLAKLISIVVSFREENLRIVRGDSVGEESKPSSSESKSIGENLDSSTGQELSVGKGDDKVGNESSLTVDDSDDDWEGVESTELDEAFSAATAFVAAAAADRLSHKVSNDVQLQLYGLYKIATEGPCSAPQPSVLKIAARAKWQAWQKLGAMPPEEAMLKYISIVTELYPSWATAIVSLIAVEILSGVLSCQINKIYASDALSEGRTPLHWAVDRGHLNITELLVRMNADVNAKDNEGQSALHYAAVCEREAIAEFLVKQSADVDLKDDDGNSPYDLCDTKWPWLQHAVA